jgi:hypothetical protein
LTINAIKNLQAIKQQSGVKTMANEITFRAVFVRNPIAIKSENWHDNAHHWHITINGQSFDYFTGLVHRISTDKGTRKHDANAYDKLKYANLKDTRHNLQLLLSRSEPKKPTLDDVLYGLVSDAGAAEITFNEWCGTFGYDTDSRKAFDTYHACQETHDKLIKARINITAERERLEDY